MATSVCGTPTESIEEDMRRSEHIPMEEIYEGGDVVLQIKDDNLDVTRQ